MPGRDLLGAVGAAVAGDDDVHARQAAVGGEAVDYTEIMYEAYGAAGVALLIEVLTDKIGRAHV